MGIVANFLMSRKRRSSEVEHNERLNMVSILWNEALGNTQEHSTGAASALCSDAPQRSHVVRNRGCISPYRVAQIIDGVSYAAEDRGNFKRLTPSDLRDGYYAIPGPPQALTLKELFARHPTLLSVPSWSDRQLEPFWSDTVTPGVFLVRHDPAEAVPRVKYFGYRYPCSYRSPNIAQAVWCTLILRGVTGSSAGLERLWTATRFDGNQLVLDAQGRFGGAYTLQSFGGKKRDDTRFLPLRQITCE
jgi:hypothetical protein